MFDCIIMTLSAKYISALFDMTCSPSCTEKRSLCEAFPVAKCRQKNTDPAFAGPVPDSPIVRIGELIQLRF